MELKTLKLSLLFFGVFTFSQTIYAQQKVERVTELTEEAKQNPINYNSIFKKLDADKNGTITQEEFVSNSKNDYNTKDQLNKRFARIDSDSDTVISLKEFNVWMAKKR